MVYHGVEISKTGGLGDKVHGYLWVGLGLSILYLIKLQLSPQLALCRQNSSKYSPSGIPLAKTL